MYNINNTLSISYTVYDDDDIAINYYSTRKDKMYLYHTKDASVDSFATDPRVAGTDFFVDTNKRLYILRERLNNILVQYNYGNTKIINSKTETSPYVTLTANDQLPLQLLGNQLLLYTVSYYDIRQKKEKQLYYKSPTLAIFDISKDSLIKEREFGIFPTHYLDHSYNEALPIAVRAGSDRVLYMFNNDNVIYNYNIKAQRVSTQKIGGLERNHLEQFDDNKDSELSYALEYFQKNSQYVKILYDDVRHKILVFQALPAPTTGTTSQISTHMDKPLLLYNIDSNSKVSGRIYFDNNEHIFLYTSYYHNGLLYVPERIKNSKNTLKIYVYKIK